MVTVTLLSLVLTGLPFFNQAMVIGTESTEHSSDRLVPAMRGEPILSSDISAASGEKCYTIGCA